MLKHKYFLLISLICTMFITSCNETDITTSTDNTTVTTTQPTTTAVTTSTTQDTSAVTFGTQSTEWERELTESEKQALLDEMPEIVFVMSHHYDNTNILGFYITKYGEIKMYDFRTIAPDEIYEIPDVFDRLEEATCDRLAFGIYDQIFENGNVEWQEEAIYSDDYKNISREDIFDAYQMSIGITKEAKLKKVQFVPSWIIGDHQYYCVRNKGEQQEILLIGGYSEEHTYEAPTDDKSTDSLYNKIYKWFPELPYYDNIV